MSSFVQWVLIYMYQCSFHFLLEIGLLIAFKIFQAVPIICHLTVEVQQLIFHCSPLKESLLIVKSAFKLLASKIVKCIQRHGDKELQNKLNSSLINHLETIHLSQITSNPPCQNKTLPDFSSDMLLKGDKSYSLIF